MKTKDSDWCDVSDHVTCLKDGELSVMFDTVSSVKLQVELTSSLLTPAVREHRCYVFQVW